MTASEPGGLFEPLGRWGLLPERVEGAPRDARGVLRHWFVHFNPLYLLSACCVLIGVFLVNRSLDRLPESPGDAPRLILFVVIQAYELLVVAGAAFLARRARAVRPAVLLVLLEALFLFDGTLRIESLLLRSPLRFGVTAVWLALVPLKVWAMAAALGVRLPRSAYARVVGAATALATVVHLLARPSMDPLVVLQVAAWLGAVVIVLLDVRRVPASTLARTPEERFRAQRCTRGAFRILAGAYFVHVWAYLLVESSLEIACKGTLAQIGTVLLLVAIRTPSDARAWLAGGCLVVWTLLHPAALPLAALVAATAWAWRAWSGGSTAFVTGAALAVYASWWLGAWPAIGNAPAVLSWPTLALAVALAAIAWRLHDRLAAALVGLGGVYVGALAWQRVAPRSDLLRGIAAIASGFALLVVGLAVNWRLRAPGPSSPQRT